MIHWRFYFNDNGHVVGETCRCAIAHDHYIGDEQPAGHLGANRKRTSS